MAKQINSYYEKIIIGAWLATNNLKDTELLETKDFPTYGYIVNAIKAVYKKNKTLPSVGDFMLQVHKKCNVPLEELANIMREYGFYEESYNNAIQQMFEQKAREYMSEASALGIPVGEMQEHITELMNAVESKNTPVPPKNYSEIFLNELDERDKRKVINTKIPALDKMLGGLNAKELITVGARPSVGKSAFVLQLALEVASQGEKVLFFPLEMSLMQTLERIVMRDVEISHKRLRSGHLEHEGYDAIAPALENLYALESSGNFVIYEGVNNLPTIKSLVKSETPYLIIIDQLEQLNDSSMRFKDKRERFSHMTNQLKRLALSENVCVVLAAQLNRAGEQKAEPAMSDLKESGSIEEDSDGVILLHRQSLDNVENYNIPWSEIDRPIQVNLAKNRNGETGDFLTVFRANRFRFYEVSKE